MPCSIVRTSDGSALHAPWHELCSSLLGLPQAAIDLMLQCLSLEPAERPTAQEVLERLTALQGPSRHVLINERAGSL